MRKPNLTIGELARSSGLSRSTLLYYDRLGLLRPRQRTDSNYRIYASAEVRRLEQICLHRRMGIPLKEIKTMLDAAERSTSVEILRRRFETLGREIANLRRQQRCVAKILEQESLYEEIDMINKERWIEIMRAAGLKDRDMHNWHVQFEKMEPEAHQEFLESLGIEPDEIAGIRESCRKDLGI